MKMNSIAVVPKADSDNQAQHLQVGQTLRPQLGCGIISTKMGLPPGLPMLCALKNVAALLEGKLRHKRIGHRRRGHHPLINHHSFTQSDKGPLVRFHKSAPHQRAFPILRPHDFFHREIPSHRWNVFCAMSEAKTGPKKGFKHNTLPCPTTDHRGAPLTERKWMCRLLDRERQNRTIRQGTMESEKAEKTKKTRDN